MSDMAVVRRPGRPTNAERAARSVGRLTVVEEGEAGVDGVLEVFFFDFEFHSFYAAAAALSLGSSSSSLDKANLRPGRSTISLSAASLSC